MKKCLLFLVICCLLLSGCAETDVTETPVTTTTTTEATASNTSGSAANTTTTKTKTTTKATTQTTGNATSATTQEQRPAVTVDVPSMKLLQGGKAIFEDGTFANGLQVESIPDAKGNKKRRTFRFEPVTTNQKPKWSISQIFSKFDIVGPEPQWFDDGSYGYINEGKRISMITDAEGDRALRLEVFGQVEYPKDEVRDNWPHLLLCYEANTGPLTTTLDKLVYSMDTRILYSESGFKEGETLTNHNVSQTTVYFTIQNRNQASAGYGEYYWFGLSVFDCRYEFPSTFQHLDIGSEDRLATGQLIYVVGGQDFLEEKYGGVNPRDGEWAHLEVDILPYLRQGLEEAQKNGLMQNTTFEDLGIGGFNFGWEVPGTVNCAMEMANIQLVAYE